MNRADLLAQVSAAVIGWVSTASEPSKLTRASRVHQHLLGIVRRSGATARHMAALRKALITEINTASRELASESLKIVTNLSDAQFGFDVENPDGYLARTTFSMDQVPQAKRPHKVLGLACRVHVLNINAQAQVMRVYELKAELEEKKVDRFHAETWGDAIEIEQARRALSRHRSRIEKLVLEAPRAAQSFLEDYEYYLDPTAWCTWALPVLVTSSSSDANLVEASLWFERLRSVMYRPLPIDTEAHLRRYGAGDSGGETTRNAERHLDFWAYG